MNIATTLRYVNFNNGSLWEERYYIMNDYLLMAEKYKIGMHAVMSPFECERICELCDGLIIPGSGTNIHPKYYGGVLEGDAPAKDEYALDAKLIDLFFKAGKPVFGICGGLQAINVYFGGTIKKLDDYYVHQNEETKRHVINVKEESFVHDVFKSARAEVNCYHNWEIDRLAPSLEVVARTDDGVIEAVQHTAAPVYATQWHPEQSFHTGDPTEHLFFENFLKECRERAK